MAPNWGANQGNGSSEYCNPGNLIGKLAAIWVIQYIADAGATKHTKPGDKTDAIQIDIVVLDPTNPAASTIHRTQLWRAGRFIGALKQFVGSPDPCLVTVVEEQPGNQTTRKLVFVGTDENATAVAGAWYESLGEAGFTPSAVVPYQAPVQQQAQQFGGWPQGAVPAAQYYQQQQAQQPGYMQPGQQQQWGQPQQQMQPGWGQPPQQQWGAPPQQQAPAQQWGQPQQPPAPTQPQWGAQQQPAAPTWGPPPQQAPAAAGQPQWGPPPQQAPAQQQPQWGPPPAAAQPPQAQQPTVMEMLANGAPQGMPDQGTPPF